MASSASDATAGPPFLEKSMPSFLLLLDVDRLIRRFRSKAGLLAPIALRQPRYGPETTRADRRRPSPTTAVVSSLRPGLAACPPSPNSRPINKIRCCYSLEQCSSCACAGLWACMVLPRACMLAVGLRDHGVPALDSMTSHLDLVEPLLPYRSRGTDCG